MNNISISRRRFAQLLGVGAAASVVRPGLSLAIDPSEPVTPDDVVRISYNENPYGPSPKALKAMTDAFNLANRYPIERNDPLIEALAKLNGVNPDQIILGDGSDELIIGVRDDLDQKDHRRGVRIYKALDDKGAKWARHILDDGGGAVEDLTIGDLDGDGRIDIIAVGRATKNIRIYWNEGGKK